MTRSELERVIELGGKANDAAADDHTHRMWKQACLQFSPEMARALLAIHESIDAHDECLPDAEIQLDAIKRILGRPRIDGKVFNQFPTKGGGE